GLCMFDAAQRLVLCNPSYLSMYGLSPDVVKPGCTASQILHYRIKLGTLSFTLDPEEYVAKLMATLAQGKSTHQIVETGDRVLSWINTPLPDGGWVVPHEDVTVQHKAEKERDRMSAEEARRKATDTAIASFRERVEAVLRTVGESAAAMKSTATTLS